MHFLTDIIVALLTGYLAFTNLLAENILRFFPSDGQEIVATELNTPLKESSFSTLPSSFSPNHFIDILRTSTEYQRASLIEGISSPSNPLQSPDEAVVNITCTFTNDDFIRTTTGTGFFVHPSGVILTNAHVAQYLLLASTKVYGDADCMVKSNTPSTPDYHAELLYLPPTWIKVNASLITEAVPMGTGERDYALLYVTSTLDGDPLPTTFPALPFSAELLPLTTKDTIVRAAGYPAPDGVQKNNDLSLVFATTTISELYTFGSNYADVFSIRGSDVGAGGSSGGPILNENNQVIGMITTRGNDAVDGKGSLRAITISHIHRTIMEETGFTLDRNVSGDVHYRADVFKRTLTPFLLSLLTEQLEN